MSDLRTAIILNLTGNLPGQSRRFGRDLERMGRSGGRAMMGLRRGLSAMGRGLDRLGNRYTAFLTGAAGIGAVRMVGNLEMRFTRLGIQAGASADAMQRLKEKIFAVSQAPDIRIDPGQLTAAVEEIVEKTGDLKFAQQNLHNLAAAIQATGASGQAIGGISAEFEKMGLKDPKDVLKALDILDVQGKKGAFTLQNLAALGPRVITAYTSMGRTGLPAIREMGAALQIIRQGTGTSDEAATAFESLIRTLNDAQKIKMLRAGGIKIFDPKALKEGKQILRPINQLMVEIIKAAKGRKTILSKIFDQEGIRAFNTLASEFQRTGAIHSIDKFYNVQADGKTIMRDSARAARAFDSALTNLNTAFKQFSDRELTKPIKELTDYLNGLAPGTVERWMNIAKWVGVLGGGAIVARKLHSYGSWASGLFRAADRGLGASGKGAGAVPVFVTNPGFGGAGAAGAAAASGMSAVGATALALAPAAGAATMAAVSRSIAKHITRNQVKMFSSSELRDRLARTNVMGGGPNSYYARQLQAEIDRRKEGGGMSGHLKISVQDDRLEVAHMQSKNLDLTVDTGRLMAAH